MTDIVTKALALAEAKASAFPSARVERPLDAGFDLGNLLTWSENEISADILNNKTDEREAYIRDLARDNAQLLYNAIWELPTERVEEAIVAKLPPPSFALPREKPVPKPKPPTKWELYAKEKGIEKKKKTRLVWDDVVKNWVPRFGYKKAKVEEEKNWMMEYKEAGVDQNTDPFEKAIQEKRERVAKNELQRLRNIAKSKKVTLPGVGLTPLVSKGSAPSNSQDLQKAADLAKKSTASLGKFQEKLPAAMEKKVKPQGQKRKFDPLIQDPNKEKSRNLEILDRLSSKKSKLDVNKAVGAKIQEEERSREEEKKNGKRGKKGGGKGGGSTRGQKRSGVKRNRKSQPGKGKKATGKR